MIYFTSDQHFGHANIIRLCDRPFETAEEMNQVMLQRWNSKVANGDTVYFLGDLFFRDREVIVPILDQLKGHKHLILGNHDDFWLGKVDVNRYFESVSLMAEVQVNGQWVTLCHYPMVTWKNMNKTYMVHGHIHGNTNADYWPLLWRRENVLNASVEVNDYYPVTFEELVENNRKWKEAHPCAEVPTSDLMS